MKKLSFTPRPLKSSHSQSSLSSAFTSRHSKLKPTSSQHQFSNRNSPFHLPQIKSPKLHSLPTRLSPAALLRQKVSSTQKITTPAIQQHLTGKVKSFGCNSLSGLVRQQNQDRTTVIGNIPQPANYRGFHWPKCSYFAVYDGHGGSACSQFLKQHLHQFVINNENFPHNPKQALIKGFAQAENEFVNMACSVNNFSGSCAVVALIVADRCYIANLGDSRAVLSYRQGSRTMNLTVDHKPNSEKERIEAAGGSVYHNQNGVYRINPGKLAVSRSFGDIKSKIPKLGGVPGALSAVPQVWSFILNEQADFILLASDGVFDVMKNQTVVDLVWAGIKRQRFSFRNCGEIVNSVLQTALNRNSQDNVSCIVINFKYFDQ